MSECVCVPVKPVSRNEEPYFSRAWNRFAQVEVQERRELCYFWSVGEHLSLAVNEASKTLHYVYCALCELQNKLEPAAKKLKFFNKCNKNQETASSS